MLWLLWFAAFPKSNWGVCPYLLEKRQEDFVEATLAKLRHDLADCPMVQQLFADS